jgi:hypothetical protein
MRRFLSLAVVPLLFASCHGTQRSRAWEIVRASRHPGPGERNRSATYAGELHKTLEKSGIGHKIVTFKFRYYSRLTLNTVGEETAVIYRDDSNAARPWWLMADYLWAPVWLPNQEISSQVAFSVRRPATVVKVEDLSAAPPKTLPKAGPSRRSAHAVAKATPRL